MNILDDNKIDLIKYMKIALLEKNTELEYIYKGNLKIEDYLNLVSFCKEKYKKMDVLSTLDIKMGKTPGEKLSYQDVRTTIIGIHNIKQYCNTDKLDDSMDLEFMEKTNYYKDGERYTIDNEDYNYRINLKNEIDLSNDNAQVINLRDNWDKSKKFFRFKKRNSFLTYDNLFRIDLTVTKSNKLNKAGNNRELYKTFKEANILKNIEKYELEVEYVGNMLLNKEVNIINFINKTIKTNEIEENGIPVNNIYESPKIIETTTTNKIILESLNELVDQTEIYKTIESLISEEQIISVIDQYNSVLYDLNSYLTKSLVLIKISDKEEILNEYLKLTNQPLNGYKQFMAPNPITIDFNQLNIEFTGNILQNYLVTEKADGDRYLLFILETKGYLINSKWEILDIGITFDLEGTWLLDGEYIIKDKDQKDINLYMIFDVYFANNKPVHKEPYISIKKSKSRAEEIEIFRKSMGNMKYIDDLNIDKRLRIYIKNYEKGSTKIEPVGSVNFEKNKKILSKSKKILELSNKNGYEYKIDGLIFLPSNLPVKATYEWKPGSEAPELIGGKWPLNYKWKPEEENTIDFQVRIETEQIKSMKRDIIYPYKEYDENGLEIFGNYKNIKLFVFYKESDDNHSDICMKMLTEKYKGDRNDRKKFTPPYETIDYGITNIPLKKDKIICERDGNELRNNDIVEMRYNKDWEKDGNGFKWTPLRLRRDKESPQHFKAANNIWKTIKTPITKKMIMGDIDLENIEKEVDILGATDDYYQESEKETPYTKPLRRFHNYIKSKLIGGIGSSNELPENKKILDTSIGRGGDINKFSNPEINCSFIFGLDISPVEVACNRYYFDKKQDKMKAVFIRYDTSKNIKDQEGIENWGEGHHGLEFSKNMLNILYNKNIDSLDTKYMKIDKKYNGLAENGFNLISSQFSIHYYFKNEETLDGYLKNIRDNCKKGGYFIGTCYDGNRVFERLKSDKPFEYTDELGNIIYKIEKKYDMDNFTYNGDGDSENVLGKEINVYMDSIGKDISEYLVNFEYFIEKMKQYGFEPHKPRMKFKYNRIIDSSIGSFESIKDKIPDLMKDETGDNLLKSKQFNDATKILDNPELLELTNMNNYFIFKKIK